MAKKQNATSSSGAKPARKGSGAKAQDEKKDEARMTAKGAEETAPKASSGATKKNRSSAEASAAAPASPSASVAAKPRKTAAAKPATPAAKAGVDTAAPTEPAVATAASSQPDETPAAAMAPEEREQVAAMTSAASPQSAPLDRDDMIALAAYLRAEARGFVGGDPVEDWLAAEAEVDARLRQQGGA